jgi:5-methylcytosine-specific restriction endonuclease McrA
MASDIRGPLPLGSLPKPPKREPRAPKRITTRGEKTIEYEHWRDTVAIPYLDATYGHKCADCGTTTRKLDVDHIRNRGSHPELKMVLANLAWRCRTCHRAKTDRLDRTPVMYEEIKPACIDCEAGIGNPCLPGCPTNNGEK